MTRRTSPSPRRAARAWRGDLRWGLGWGAWMAGFFTVLAVAGLARPGADQAPARHHTSFPAYVAYLWAVSAVAGGGAAVLRPWLTRRWGAAVLGWFICAVAIAGVYVLEGYPMREGVAAVLWLARPLMPAAGPELTSAVVRAGSDLAPFAGIPLVERFRPAWLRHPAAGADAGARAS